MTDNPMDNIDLKDPKHYEIGYLLSPLVPENDKAEIITEIVVKAIERAQGTVTGQTPAVMRKLAYSIGKTINHKKSVTTDAYFGAVRFTTTPNQVGTIKETVDKDERIIRTLLIEITPGQERPTVSNRPLDQKADSENKDNSNTVEEKLPVDEEKIDKEIEGLLTNAQ